MFVRTGVHGNVVSGIVRLPISGEVSYPVIRYISSDVSALSSFVLHANVAMATCQFVQILE